MRISKQTKKAGLSLIGGMLGYIVAKRYCHEEIYPFTLIGGFIGTLIGEETIKEAPAIPQRMERFN